MRETGFDPSNHSADLTTQELYRQLISDEKGNEMIIDDVLTKIEKGRSPILLTERREHLDLLHQRLKRFVRRIVVLRGG